MGSQPGAVLSPEAFGNVWRHFRLSQMGCGVGWMILAFSRWRPEILLNILQCTGQPHCKIIQSQISVVLKPWEQYEEVEVGVRLGRWRVESKRKGLGDTGAVGGTWFPALGKIRCSGFGCLSWEQSNAIQGYYVLSGSGWRPGMLLNFLQCTG